MRKDLRCLTLKMDSINSKRQRRKYTEEGFIYIFDKMSSCGSKLFWRCEQKDYCKARIHTQNGITIKKINEHSHDSSAAKVEADLVVSRIKQRAGEVLETTGQVINACIGELSEAAYGAMPKQDALRKMVRRKRNLENVAPPAPDSVENLIIPEQYRVYKLQDGTEENFLLADSGPVPGRILVFGRQRNLQVNFLFL